MKKDLLITGGDKIEGLVWQWSKGNTKFFTGNFDKAHRAIREGLSVVAIKSRSKIIRNLK